MTYSKWNGPNTVGGLKHNLKDMPDETPLAWSTWQVDDVEYWAETKRMEVSKKEAADILSAMNLDLDSTIGMTWDTIGHYLDELREDRENRASALLARNNTG